MVAVDPMTIDERRKCVRTMQKRYRKATPRERRRLLDEMRAVVDLHRKSLTRLAKSELALMPRTYKRGPSWVIDIYRAAQVIA